MKKNNYISWMGGAGFFIEYNGVKIGLDLYMSNQCMNEKGEFKRLTPPPCAANSLKLDYLISSHDHGDHLDMGNLKEWFEINKALKLIGPDSSLAEAKKLIPDDRMLALNRGGKIDLTPDIVLEGVYCDHGDQSPDSIGVILNLGGLRIYFMGDMQYHSDITEVTGVKNIDIMLPPINPGFGNPGADGAAKMTKMTAPKTVVPCHYWLFKEHGCGDPGTFENICREIAPDIEVRVLAMGEKMGI